MDGTELRRDKMPKDDDLLRKITTFPKLVEYLRDELQWPIEVESFDDLTFEYEAEELGLDPKIAVKIHSIKQLRPLTAGQPWGVFFVEFERKRLPVVVMRRILSALALKRRASAGKGNQAAWQTSDLLFLSSFGEEGGRGITFAHFAPDEEGHDLPSLKVLGWDGDDTKLHTQAVAEALASSLVWPSDERNVDAWRTQWCSAFVLANREVAETSRELSIQLAKLAVGIRERAKALLASESDRGPLRRLHKAFRGALLHDLSEDGFADMYAQTVAYGLLAARLENPDAATPLTASALADMIPATSPFLKGLLSTFLKVGGRKGYLDFDELGIGDVVDLLRNANMKAILLDFGDLKPDEDPVLQFYELFLNEYDHAQKMQRGVFYTPKPVVHYIVHNVDEILRTEFDVADGLADTVTWSEMAARHSEITIPKGIKGSEPFVQVLDPATGTATFLVEVIDVIYATMTAKWRGQHKTKNEIDELWNEYVPQHLLPRLYGYEIQMAPYTIAHIKFGLKLRETGYRFGSTERARIYMTNTLEDPDRHMERLAFDVPALAAEAVAVTEVKHVLVPTVVIGNPPYSGVSRNMNPWIVGLLKGKTPDGRCCANYYQVDGKALAERKVWLQDDYVKFIRYSHYLIQKSGCGILGFITNHGYLDNTTFRGMRNSLLDCFTLVNIVELHGDSKRGDRCPDSSKDENVFDIEVGVSIGIYTKPFVSRMRRVWYSELWGNRADKYARLNNMLVDCPGLEVNPQTPDYFFIPIDTTLTGEYERGLPLNELMPLNVTGIVTARDDFVIGADRAALKKRIDAFGDLRKSDSSIQAQYDLHENYAWRIADARRSLPPAGLRERHYRSIYYRPFDIRWVFYHDSVVWRTRRSVMRHLEDGGSIAIVCSRQQATQDLWSLVGVSAGLTESSYVSNKTSEIGYVFPVFLLPSPEGQDFFGSAARTVNVSASAMTRFAYNLKRSVKPEDIVYYSYSLLFSPAYRKRYANQLRLSFPRILVPQEMSLFNRLDSLGRQLINSQLLRDDTADSAKIRYLGPSEPRVSDAHYDARSERIYLNGIAYLGPVHQEEWDFRVGCHKVLQKWLKDRSPRGGEPGRVLSLDDILQYRKVVTAIAKTIELQAEIDRVIVVAGGFPAAFVTNQQ
jgi:hypothetical protein